MKINYNISIKSISLVIVCLSLNIATLFAQISVKDFGAKGDGKTDDTKAILAAISALNSSAISTNVLPNGMALPVYIGSIKTLSFPQGIYVISGSLKLGSYVRIEGIDAILISSSKSVANFPAIDCVGWQVNIEGLQIVGFSTAIRIDNKNADTGKISISNCNFYNNNQAIELAAQSSISNISACRFINNIKSINIISGDKVIVENNWIGAGKLSGNQPANIINNGVLNFNNNLLVPSPLQKGTIEPAWINNYGSVSCESIRQGGEEGSVTLINNFAKFNNKYPVIPSSISVKNSDCYAVYRNDENVQPAVIRLFELPNQIVLEDIRGMVDAKVIGHSFSKIKNPSAWSRQYTNDQKLIKIRMANILGGIEESTGNALPAYLKQFAESDNYQLAKTKNSVQEEILVNKTKSRVQQKGQLPSFEYEFIMSDLTANYLLSYSGNPNVNGSGSYNGGIVSILKCNGIYYQGKVTYHITSTNVSNNAGEENGKDRPYKYTLVWKSTGSPYKPVNDTNNSVLMKIENSTESERVNVVNLSTL